MAKMFQTYFFHNNGKWTATQALGWGNDFRIISNCASNLYLESEKVWLIFLITISRIWFFSYEYYPRDSWVIFRVGRFTSIFFETLPTHTRQYKNLNSKVWITLLYCNRSKRYLDRLKYCITDFTIYKIMLKYSDRCGLHSFVKKKKQ